MNKRPHNLGDAMKSLTDVGCRIYHDDHPMLTASERALADSRVTVDDPENPVFGIFLQGFSGDDNYLLNIRNIRDVIDVTILDSAIGRSTIEALLELPNLRHLTLHGITLTKECLPLFPRMRQLRFLALGDSLPERKDLEAIAIEMPWCKVHWHVNEPPVTDEGAKVPPTE